MAAKVTGRAQFRAKLAALPKVARTEMHRALKQNGQEMVSLARSLAPVEDGDLRQSIGMTFGVYRAENANVRGVSSSVGAAYPELSLTVHVGDAKAFYAAFVEFGTKPHINGGKFAGTRHPGAAAHPFFFPAYRALKPRLKRRMSRAMTAAAKKVAGSGGTP